MLVVPMHEDGLLSAAMFARRCDGIAAQSSIRYPPEISIGREPTLGAMRQCGRDLVNSSLCAGQAVDPTGEVRRPENDLALHLGHEHASHAGAFAGWVGREQVGSMNTLTDQCAERRGLALDQPLSPRSGICPPPQDDSALPAIAIADHDAIYIRRDAAHEPLDRDHAPRLDTTGSHDPGQCRPRRKFVGPHSRSFPHLARRETSGGLQAERLSGRRDWPRSDRWTSGAIGRRGRLLTGAADSTIAAEMLNL